MIEVPESTFYLYGSLSKDPLVSRVSGRVALVDLANQEQSKAGHANEV